MIDLKLDFERFEDGAEVEVFIEITVEKDSDYFEVGQQIVWQEYFTTEWTASYFVNGVFYKPTDDELKDWEGDIEIAVNKKAVA